MNDVAIEYMHLEDGAVRITDNRSVDACREFAIRHLRDRCTETILASAPEHKQRNAALGLLDTVEHAQIVQTIALNRARYAALEAVVNGVQWDGFEATRASACDAIMAISWDSTQV
jgi:hypothetical protein